MKWTTAFTLGAILIAVGCSDATNGVVPPPPPPPAEPPPPPPPPAPPGALVIRSEDDTTATSDTLLVGSNVWLRVMGIDSTAAVQWTVSDTAVVHVVERRSARIHVNGHKAGGVTMTAALGDRSGTFPLAVRDVPAGAHPPNARITGPTSATEGTTVTLKATESSDPDHDALRFKWSFGDGSATDTASSLTHTYSDNGSRTVTLIATDPAGLADTASLTVAVKNAPPVISALAAPSAPVNLGDSASVTATVSDPGTADVLTITFDWGDGKTTSGPESKRAHLYSAAGTYSVKATVREPLSL